MAESYDIHLTDPLSAAFQVRAFTSNGTIFPTSSNLNSTAVGADTSLLVYGKGHPNYGERIAENIIHILENFSGSTEPLNPVSGQLWYERITAVQINGTPQFRIYEDGSGWGAAFTPDLTGDLGAASDGDYYWNGSALFLAVKDSSNPLAPTWLQRSFEDLSATGVVPASPRKVLRVYTGEGWKDVQNIHSTVANAAPTSADEGDLWYNQDTEQLMIYDVGLGGWTSVAENYLPLAGGTMDSAANITMTGGGEILGLPATPSATGAASKEYVDAATGTVPTNLPDLGDVAGTTVPTSGQFLRGDGLEWSNSVINVSDISGVTASASNLNELAGYTLPADVQTTLNGKLNLSGGNMAGSIDMGSFAITNLLDPTPGSQEAATASYVDAAVAAPSTAMEDLTDVQYIGGSPATIPVTGQLLEYNGTDWVNSDYTHTHVSTEITHTSSQKAARDLASGSYPDINLSELLESFINNHSTRLDNLDDFARREVFTVAGSPATNTDFSFTDGRYRVGSNRLQVYVNGIKQYANERARQSIQFDIFKNVSSSSLLGLPPHAGGSPAALNKYYLDIAIDGEPATSVEFTLDETSTIATIVTQINSALSSGYLGGSPLTTMAYAAWNKIDSSIHVFSFRTGAGSSIEITEPAVDGLLTALTNVALGSPPDPELPVLTYLGGSPDATVIYPAFGTNITQVTSDLAYQEVDDNFNPTYFGQVSSSIRFNSALTAGAVVEMISTSTADTIN